MLVWVTKYINRNEPIAFNYHNSISPIKMPYKRTYKKKSSKRKAPYKRKSYAKKRKMTRKTYKKGPDTGTYLKVSSTSIPFIIDNNFVADPLYVQTPDTYQGRFDFNIGSTDAQENLKLNDNVFASGSGPSVQTIQLGLDSGDWSAYASLYKYVQIYKIVVQYIPTITQGSVLQNITTDATGAVAGTFTTDIDREGVTGGNYWQEYTPDLEGQAKSMSRKVTRTKTIYKGWTRTFRPSRVVTGVDPNPKAKYQYQPDYELQNFFPTFTEVGDQNFIIRCRKPQYSGFPAASEDALDIDFPQQGNYVRAGTIRATAYIKFTHPFN